MKIEIAKDHSSQLVLQLKVDDHTIQVPITTSSKIEISLIEKDHHASATQEKPFCRRQFDLDNLRETYSKEMQMLSDRGFHERPRKYLKLLSRFNGDVDKVCSVIEERRRFFRSWKKPSVPEEELKSSVPESQAPVEHSSPKKDSVPIPCRKSGWCERIAKLKETYATQLEQLSQMGFEHTHWNIRLLKKHDGDLNQVLEALLSGKRPEGGWCGFGDPERLKKLESQYASQLAFLNQQGFDTVRLNLMALRKHDGDQDGALMWLQEWKAFKEEHASQLEELANRGFENPRMRLVGLKKCNGDVDLATEWLKARQQRNHD